MENSTSSTNQDHPTVWLKEDDKFFPCNALADKYLNQCYFYQANYLIKITDHNYQSVFNDCYTLKGSHQNYCLMGLGANLASFSNETSIQNAAAICGLGKGFARQICIEGAIPSLMARYGGETAKVILFCHSSPLDLQELCFVKLGAFAKSWQTNGQLEQICQPAKDYQKACLGESTIQPKI